VFIQLDGSSVNRLWKGLVCGNALVGDQGVPSYPSILPPTHKLSLLENLTLFARVVPLTVWLQYVFNIKSVL